MKTKSNPPSAVNTVSVADEILRLKFNRLQAESKIAKARAAMVSAELNIRIIDHCIKALSASNTSDEPRDNAARS